MSDTFLSLSRAISMHRLVLLCFLITSAALFGLFTLIFHISTQSLGGVTRSRFYQSLIAGFIARTSPHRWIAGLCLYTLQEATSSNTYPAAQGAYQLDYVMSSR